MESTLAGFDKALDSYDFSGFGVVVDVGGGQGTFLARLLQRQPGTRGVLFDQPRVVAGAADRLRRLGVADRIEIAGGDMFQQVPAGGDAYCMFTVLRCFEDAAATRVLSRCAEAMGDTARLLVVDMLVPDGPAVLPAARTDLMAMVLYGAGDRTETQWRELLGGTGFAVRRIVPIDELYVVIEATPAR